MHQCFLEKLKRILQSVQDTWFRETHLCKAIEIKKNLVCGEAEEIEAWELEVGKLCIDLRCDMKFRLYSPRNGEPLEVESRPVT